ncbi:hypothetical protein ACQ86N_33570 [Puia sp. P3]|uniref:hypothetical protein n=1 Tax=Puia sp. P3 TaxID=3423952 RepID=UPI003D67C5D2
MRNFHLLFWPLLVAALIVLFIKLKDKSYLQNDTTPNGIISLELGSTYTADTAIVQSSKSDTLDRTTITLCQPHPRPIQRLHKARFDVFVDFGFIFIYTLLGFVIITTLQSRIQKGGHWSTRLLIGLLLLAAFLDCLENIGLLSFINDGINHEPRASGTTAFITHIAAWANSSSSADYSSSIFRSHSSSGTTACSSSPTILHPRPSSCSATASS